MALAQVIRSLLQTLPCRRSTLPFFASGEVVAGDVGHTAEKEEEVTDGSLVPSVVDEAVEGDGDTTVLAVLLDTDGPSGPSVVDKVVEGDGDTTVLAVLPDIYGTDGPLGSSDTNMA